MKLGMVGLGRMGANMTTRLLLGGHEVVAFDFSAEAVQRTVAEGAIGASSLEELVTKLSGPKIVWIMVPAGKPTDDTITSLLQYLSPGDVIIDGGNSNFRESKARCVLAKEKGVDFIDAGTSGGVWGLKNGYCLMVGGDADAVKKVEPIFITLAPKDGYAYVGPSGAGHFSKMVHNGIEYAMLAGYGEGFEILEKSEYNYDLHQLADLWLHASVVRSWLLELAEIAFREDPHARGRTRIRRRLRRGPLDRSRGDQRERSRARHHDVSYLALRLASTRIVQRQSYCGAPQPVRRPPNPPRTR